ncbi:B-cell receptor CD22-like [Salminus brasiliensis]|uniref:B-cell receptor CD22-like n=1 Tax=Salminus brasiliensis TaxID=930266 RepID=UPI003B830A4F
MSLTVPLLVLIFISGAAAQNGWSVNYSPKSICALKGSTVNMDCSYTYPHGHSVQKAFWTKDLVRPPSEPPSLLNDTEYSGRVQYLGDKQHKSTIRLRDVTEKDQRKYYFRFTTDQPGGQYQGADGVDLSVTDLQVEGPERVMEGGEVTLTCKTTCNLTDRPTFTWYRNGAPLSSSTYQLHLQSVSREDAGRYHCAVEGQKLHSPEVTLNVRYGVHQSVSVSISPSGEIMEGSSVTLTCNSDGNPPVEYTWFKGTSFIATGKTFTMKKISSVNSGGYKCMSSNKNEVKSSDPVTLNVLYPPKTATVSISPSGEIMEGSSVTLTCSSEGNPPVEYKWFEGTSLVAKGKTFTINKISSVDGGEYKCRSSNEHGEKSSDTVTLNVLYPPKSVSVSVSPSGEIVEGSSVTLTCSSDGNPPVQNYTWFKETSLVATGETFTMKKISSGKSGGYKCRSSNEHGEKYSDTVTLNVLYPPKFVLISITVSEESIQLNSVALTCSSDANPSAQNYTWFKRGGSSPVGSGKSYSFTLDSKTKGWYYCEAQHKLGSKKSSALPFTLQAECFVGRYVGAGVGVGLCVSAAIMAGVFLMCRNMKKKRKVEEHDYQNADYNVKNDIYEVLDTVSKCGDDGYDTVATVYSRPSDDAQTQ